MRFRLSASAASSTRASRRSPVDRDDGTAALDEFVERDGRSGGLRGGRHRTGLLGMGRSPTGSFRQGFPEIAERTLAMPTDVKRSQPFPDASSGPWEVEVSIRCVVNGRVRCIGLGIRLLGGTPMEALSATTVRSINLRRLIADALEDAGPDLQRLAGVRRRLAHRSATCRRSVLDCSLRSGSGPVSHDYRSRNVKHLPGQHTRSEELTVEDRWHPRPEKQKGRPLRTGPDLLFRWWRG